MYGTGSLWASTPRIGRASRRSVDSSEVVGEVSIGTEKYSSSVSSVVKVIGVLSVIGSGGRPIFGSGLGDSLERSTPWSRNMGSRVGVLSFLAMLLRCSTTKSVIGRT